MRIMYILSGTNAKGGASKSFRAMADAVKSAGNEIMVIAPDGNGVTPMLRERGWRTEVVPYVFCALPTLTPSLRNIVRFLPRLVKGCLLNLRARKKVLALAKEFRPDIIHENTSVTDIGHHVSKAMDIPHVIHVREYGWQDFNLVLPWLKERLTAPNAWLACITADLASFRGKGVAPDHVRVIYNGVVRKGGMHYDPDKSRYLLYAGRIESGKGVADLIDAYIAYAGVEKGAGSNPLRLKIAGGCNTPGFLRDQKRKISSAGLEEFVDFLGDVAEMEQLYSKAVATIIPSLKEGFGRVMPEAMAAGSLCVVRRSGGLAEQLENGRRLTGGDIAFSFETVEELTDALLMITSEYRKGTPFAIGGAYQLMIEAAAKTVGELYSCEANARHTLDYYAQICEAGKK